MPVSRKRKTTKKSGARSPKAAGSGRSRQGLSEGLFGGLSALAAHRRELAQHRATIAAPRLAAVVAELAGLASGTPSAGLEDQLCARLGDQLWDWSNAPRVEDHIDVDVAAEVLAAQAISALDSALGRVAADPDGWRGPWQVLTAVADIVGSDLREAIAEPVEALRDRPGGQALPALPPGPVLAGEVLWTRDAYGSRFGITAPFSAHEGPNRWYLWDVDACGGAEPLTVYSGYYPGSEQALDAWRIGVGPVAARGGVFVPVEDPFLLVDLLPAQHGFMRIGGESADQFAEYHRSRRLAELVLEDADIPAGGRPAADLDAEVAAAQFLAWRRDRGLDQPPLAEGGHLTEASMDERAEELARSWQFGARRALYHTCSPHRVALLVPHLRNFYQDDFAAELVALLPEWAAWLAARNGTPLELAERCRPYALGESYPGLTYDRGGPDPQARVIE